MRKEVVTMRKLHFVALLLGGLAVFALALVASAQGTSGSTLKSFSGTILEVDLTPPGIGCTLKTENGTVFVELGPVENFPFGSKDYVKRLKLEELSCTVSVENKTVAPQP